jgi:soluble lytic murein transglycosylase
MARMAKRIGSFGADIGNQMLAAILVVCFLALPAQGQKPVPGSGLRARSASAQPRKPEVASASSAAVLLPVLAKRLAGPDSQAGLRAYRELLRLLPAWPQPWKARAALACGFYAYRRGDYQQALALFQQGEQDRLLQDYALYWQAQAAAALGAHGMAADVLERFLREFPSSGMREQALELYARAALQTARAPVAARLLRQEPRTWNSPALLMALGKLDEATGDLAGAADAYQRVYLRFPMTVAAEQASAALQRLQALGIAPPPVGLADRIDRAEQLFQSRRYAAAAREWQAIQIAGGADADRARLRVAQCQAYQSGTTAPLLDLAPLPPALEAERWATLAVLYRMAGNRQAMLDAVDRAVQADPRGAWALRALNVAAAASWTDLDWTQAARFYARIVEVNPTAPEAVRADWRVAWALLQEKSPQAQLRLQEHVRRFPSSPFVPDALYWLGRWAEQQNRRVEARAYYRKLRSLFPHSYWALQAEQRLRRLGSSPVRDPALLRVLPRPAPVRLPVGSLPAFLRPVEERARALHAIAFDQSAYLELQQAAEQHAVPGLFLEAARAAAEAGRYMAAARLVRRVFADLEERPLRELPLWVWRLVYPLPAGMPIRRWARRAGLDPALVAALVRKESGFDPEAVSAAGAVGLMQVLPSTAASWSRHLHLTYSETRLRNPDFNLRIGCLHLASLLRRYRSLELALAAYNAGENRIGAWRTQGISTDTPEFVESIPFTETQEYVKTVLATARIYHALYRELR